MQSTDIIAEYIRRISEDIPVTLGNALKVVVDCGNGVPGTVAPDILRAIGHELQFVLPQRSKLHPGGGRTCQRLRQMRLRPGLQAW